MKVLKVIIFSLLSIATGALFLYSAYTKLFPIQTFEYTLVEYVKLPWWLASIAARGLVGLEGALGLLFLANIYGARKWVLKLSTVILVAFCVYLGYLWAVAGNNVNCGCFGDHIWMSPSSSIIKNVITLAVIGLLSVFHKGITARWAKIVSIVALIILTILPFILFPIPPARPDFLKDKSYKTDLSVLYADSSKAPATDLTKGKHVVAFMSMTCPHCKTAAYKFHLMKEKDPSLPVFFVLNGDSTQLESFWKNTKTEDLPYVILNGKPFMDFTGGHVPTVYYINNSWVDAKTSNYTEVNQAGIEQWLADDTKLSNDN